MMDEICRNAETLNDRIKREEIPFGTFGISHTATTAAGNVGAEAIVAITESGRLARRLSKARLTSPTFAYAHNVLVRNQVSTPGACARARVENDTNGTGDEGKLEVCEMCHREFVRRVSDAPLCFVGRSPASVASVLCDSSVWCGVLWRGRCLRIRPPRRRSATWRTI